MSSLRRSRRKPSHLSVNSRSPSPELYIDLTVDSPVVPRPVLRFLDLQNKDNNAGENSNVNLQDQQNDTIVIDDSDVRNSTSGTDSINANTTNRSRNRDSCIVIEERSAIKANQAISKNPLTNRNSLYNEPPTALSCPICFEELINSSTKAMTTKCGHIFCETCLQSSIQTRKKCPVCMASITLKSCIRLHL